MDNADQLNAIGAALTAEGGREEREDVGARPGLPHQQVGGLLLRRACHVHLPPPCHGGAVLDSAVGTPAMRESGCIPSPRDRLHANRQAMPIDIILVCRSSSMIAFTASYSDTAVRSGSIRPIADIDDDMNES